MHERVQRHAAEQPRVGSPSRSAVHACAALVHRQRKQQNDEAMKICATVDVRQQGSVYRLQARRLRKTQGRHRPTFGADRRPPAPRASRAARRPGCRTSSAARAAGAARCPARRRAPIAGRASSARWRWNVTAKRCASSRIRCSSSSAGSSGGKRDRLVAIARVTAALPSSRCRPRPRFARPSSSSAAYAADSCPLPPSIRIRSGNGPPCSSSLR